MLKLYLINNLKEIILTLEAIGSNSVFKFNPEVFKLDRFDGTNFTCWKDKLFLLLTELGVAYLLSRNLSTILEPFAKDDEETLATRKKRKEDAVRCICYILNSLSYRLYDMFRTINSPQEIWSALEKKYTSIKQGTDIFLGMKFFEFKMFDNKSVMELLRLYIPKAILLLWMFILF